MAAVWQYVTRLFGSLFINTPSLICHFVDERGHCSFLGSVLDILHSAFFVKDLFIYGIFITHSILPQKKGCFFYHQWADCV